MKTARTLGDIMSTEVIAVAPEMTLREVAALFAHRHISGAPVVAGGRVLGVISTTDLMRFASRPPEARATPPGRGSVQEGGGAAGRATGGVESTGGEGPPEFFVQYWADERVCVVERLSEAEGEEGALLDGHTAAEAMTPTVYALPPDTELAEAADYMLEHEIHRVLVIEEDRLVGVVTTTDMVRAMGGARRRSRFPPS